MAIRTTDPAETYLRTWTTEQPRWFTRADGSRLRYIAAGEGPPVLLLHTVRTQLDYFQRVIAPLAERRRVYALDFPGMGWSDIQKGATYDHDDLQSAVVEFVRGQELTGATLAGESIGAAIALTASVELGQRVVRVVASNTYDYPQGLERANLLARVIVSSVRAPLVGPVFAALENRPILKGIMRGGYADPAQLPEPFLDELVRVGSRPGYARVARAIYRNLRTLIAARDRYASITAPVTLLYSDGDWSREADRAGTAAAIPSASVHTVAHAGHFLALEKPREFVAAVLGEHL
ncbi:alpha/beta fold hydrolase [Mycobacterium shigaense]|uniref:Alpha/beta hydrolase n=1 Tax=Mycobacterium shigaense TaxID=722731 RepID=A0A1Z4EPW3_9MYCO|nr:alpha/beta fold hydrolase [Mycobacterium shigaense]MEA1121557.1 alpha/beta fold hydrolase [Mycobacterium shigaense]PRI15160.1 alpha/beta hydrolase [Mycobacterium shigaense]BAX95027.1 alpha/beta hydrolase [Mycobacterium shigaense]